MPIFLLFILFLFIPMPSEAACQCACVNGRQVPICERAIDLPPLCPPRLCPLVPPSIKPLNPPRNPPIGTKRCDMQQVWNDETRQYEWVQVCR